MSTASSISTFEVESRGIGILIATSRIDLSTYLVIPNDFSIQESAGNWRYIGHWQSPCRKDVGLGPERYCCGTKKRESRLFCPETWQRPEQTRTNSTLQL